MQNNQIDHKSRLTKIVNWDFISKCDIAMKLTSSNMRSDYSNSFGIISYNGLPGATWDYRHDFIWKYAEAFNFRPFALDRKRWTACVVLDEQKKYCMLLLVLKITEKFYQISEKEKVLITFTFCVLEAMNQF